MSIFDVYISVFLKGFLTNFFTEVFEILLLLSLTRSSDLLSIFFETSLYFVGFPEVRPT